MADMTRQRWRMCLALVVLAMLGSTASADLVPGFYAGKCPHRFTNVETIVRRTVIDAFKKDQSLAAGIVRIHFHDSFVHGPDASLLIAGNNTERTNPANGALHGFDLIDAAKAAVESVCPGVVSCADILSFCTRDLIWLSNGPFIRVKSGRRDGLVSLASDVNGQLPGPFQKVPALTVAFANKGLNVVDLVTLSGAHTIGKARCRTFANRLFTFNSTNPTDPNLNPDFASQLKQQCPAGQNLDVGIFMDSISPTVFDNSYYVDLLQGRGIFTSDDDLSRDPTTAPLVRSFAGRRGGRRWLNRGFPASWMKLGEIGATTGTQGEIRRVCSKFNSSP